MNASTTEHAASTTRISPETFAERAQAIEREVGRVIVGQRDLVRQTMTGLLANSHVLLEGVPGLGKTMLVRTIADVIDCTFNRIQFTPDLMPADITGTNILIEEGGARVFRFQPGPIFANLVLADEINRATPKTQSSLLEAMQEHQVTVARQRFPLDPPFFVLATQNPLEMEGTYPLPEAQLDRFLFKLQVGYPTFEQEQEVVARHDSGMDPHDLAATGIRAVASAADLTAARAHVDALRVEPPVMAYIVQLCRATRDAPSLTLGVSPRGATALLHAAKAWAWLAGRPYVTPDEVKAVTKPTLRHRIQLRPEAELEGTTADVVLDGILTAVPAPR
jgi:MoxR-like ATPase